MTKQQIRWACQHDWFLRADGIGVYVKADDGINCEYFTDYKDLRLWSGY